MGTFHLGFLQRYLTVRVTGGKGEVVDWSVVTHHDPDKKRVHSGSVWYHLPMPMLGGGGWNSAGYYCH